MTIYPFYKGLHDASQKMDKGNFGLWYNKFIPLSDAMKASDEAGKDTRPVEHYLDRYGKMKRNAAEMVRKKNQNLDDYCASFIPDAYQRIDISAELITPLITGIGESHPHEVSMVFDHNMGIPYLPASGVKGIVRFAHTLLQIPEAEKLGKIKNDGSFDDEEEWTLIPLIFGSQKRKQEMRGRVIFLDAYPRTVPEMKMDIMNPHYAPYYSDGKAPADHHNPTPIKFLTVAAGTEFIFRAIAEKKDNLSEKVITALVKALTEEGVGAKTAVGYGRFKILTDLGKSGTNPGSSAPSLQVVQEAWENAHVTFDAGGGGKVKALAKDGRKADLQGKDKILAATDEGLHKKLFEGKKEIKSARVVVQKKGNSYIIDAIVPQT